MKVVLDLGVDRTKACGDEDGCNDVNDRLSMELEGWKDRWMDRLIDTRGDDDDRQT